jgi:hypothetical protein
MYVLVALYEIQGLGLTPEEATQDGLRRFRASGVIIDGEGPGALYPCSAELYRLCEAKPQDRFIGSIPFRIEKGVAIPSTPEKAYLGSSREPGWAFAHLSRPKKKKRKRKHRPG